MGLVGQAIQERGGKGGLAKDLGPVGKAQDGGNDHRPPFVPLRQHLEKQYGAFFGKRNVASLVDEE